MIKFSVVCIVEWN